MAVTNFARELSKNPLLDVEGVLSCLTNRTENEANATLSEILFMGEILSWTFGYALSFGASMANVISLVYFVALFKGRRRRIMPSKPSIFLLHRLKRFRTINNSFRQLENLLGNLFFMLIYVTP